MTPGVNVIFDWGIKTRTSHDKCRKFYSAILTKSKILVGLKNIVSKLFFLAINCVLSWF
jgi:hypothetical protein